MPVDRDDYFRKRAEEMAARFAPAAEADEAPARPANPNRQTFPAANDGWVNVAPGTPSPLARSREVAQQPAPALDPRAIGEILQLVTGGKVDIPEQLRGALGGVQHQQLQAAPNHLQLGPGQNRPTRTFPNGEVPALPPAPTEHGVDEVKTRRRLRLPIPEGVSRYARAHRIQATVAGIALVATAGWTTARASGLTAGEALSMVSGNGLGAELVLPALDCKEPTLTADVDGYADTVWKVKVAKATDVAKAKTTKNFKVPTVDTYLPKMRLPTVAFPETEEEKKLAKDTLVDRNLQITLRNTAELIGCDETKGAYKQDDEHHVMVDRSKISLIPLLKEPGTPDAPKLARELYEKVPINDFSSKDGIYVSAPGEAARVTAAMQRQPGLQSQFRGMVLDSMNNGACKTDIRSTLQDKIEADLKKQAKEQGSYVEVDFSGDFRMPGEVYPEGKTAAQLSSKDAEIQNPKINCQNVKLVGGAQ